MPPSSLSPQSKLIMIGKTISHYRILEKLGEGGMGVVYKARDTRLDRFVAIKVLPAEKVADPERKRRFVQEAKAASSLNHAHIVGRRSFGVIINPSIHRGVCQRSRPRWATVSTVFLERNT